jgi:ketopantoate reductase
MIELRDRYAGTAIPFEIGGSEADIVWRKTLVTSVNWVAGATGFPVEFVLASPHATEALERVLDEVVPVARTEGVEVTSEELLRAFDEIRSNRGTRGSAFIALERGQPLEIVDILESIVERAAAAGVETPATAFLAALARLQQDAFARLPRVPITVSGSDAAARPPRP